MEIIASPPRLCLLDNYVHRLVQNKEDGKLVEVAGQSGMVGYQAHSQTDTLFLNSLGMRLSIHGVSLYVRYHVLCIPHCRLQMMKRLTHYSWRYIG